MSARLKSLQRRIARDNATPVRHSLSSTSLELATCLCQIQDICPMQLQILMLTGKRLSALVEAYETMARPLPLASMNEVVYTTVDQLLTDTNHFIASAQRQPRA